MKIVLNLKAKQIINFKFTDFGTKSGLDLTA